MMTAASIPAASTGGYADYLDSKTVAPETGDYDLGRDGTPAEAPGRWIGDPDALRRVGITAGVVQSDELRALMEGRRPDAPEGEAVWLRNAGPDGTRAGGLDVTFSAPKGVSVAWALGDDRAAIETAHEAAVDAALGYLRERVELTVRADHAAGTVPDTAAHTCTLRASRTPPRAKRSTRTTTTPLIGSEGSRIRSMRRSHSGAGGCRPWSPRRGTTRRRPSQARERAM